MLKDHFLLCGEFTGKNGRLLDMIESIEGAE